MSAAPTLHPVNAPLSQDAARRYDEREGAISQWCKASRPRRQRLEAAEAADAADPGAASPSEPYNLSQF